MVAKDGQVIAIIGYAEKIDDSGILRGNDGGVQSESQKIRHRNNELSNSQGVY